MSIFGDEPMSTDNGGLDVPVDPTPAVPSGGTGNSPIDAAEAWLGGAKTKVLNFLKKAAEFIQTHLIVDIFAAALILAIVIIIVMGCRNMRRAKEERAEQNFAPNDSPSLREHMPVGPNAADRDKPLTPPHDSHVTNKVEPAFN